MQIYLHVKLNWCQVFLGKAPFERYRFDEQILETKMEGENKIQKTSTFDADYSEVSAWKSTKQLQINNAYISYSVQEYIHKFQEKTSLQPNLNFNCILITLHV